MIQRDLGNGTYAGYGEPAPPPVTAGYPKLSYRTTGNHQYELSIQVRPRARKVPVGTIQRYGSLPSCQSWRGLGNWAGATWTRSRASRSAASAELWGQWRDRGAG